MVWSVEQEYSLTECAQVWAVPKTGKEIFYSRGVGLNSGQDVDCRNSFGARSAGPATTIVGPGLGSSLCLWECSSAEQGWAAAVSMDVQQH